jgi:acid phosphatase (class A)
MLSLAQSGKTSFDRSTNFSVRSGVRTFHCAEFRFRSALVAVFLFIAGMAAAFCAEPHYFSNTNLAMLLLPPPPDATSAEGRAELSVVQSAQKERRLLDPLSVQLEQHVTLFTFAPVIGSFLVTNRFPKTEWFFRRVWQDTDLAVYTAKDYWDRPRPYLVDTNLLEGLPDKFAGGYPSGHSTIATVFASLLAELFPDHKDAILVKGRQIGWHRVVLGRHYLSDILAGRVLGQRLVQEFKRNREFRRDFKDVRLEIMAWMRTNEAQ